MVTVRCLTRWLILESPTYSELARNPMMRYPAAYEVSYRATEPIHWLISLISWPGLSLSQEHLSLNIHMPIPLLHTLTSPLPLTTPHAPFYRY